MNLQTWRDEFPLGQNVRLLREHEQGEEPDSMYQYIAEGRIGVVVGYAESFLDGLVVDFDHDGSTVVIFDPEILEKLDREP